jgi:sialate O-acetylesterase
MPAFVADIRSKWDSGEFPFYYVQIAPYKYDHPDSTSGASLREVQMQHLAQIPNSGMVTTMDIGNIDFIHPSNKAKVGERLALWALGKTYGLKGFDYAPPVYKSMERIERKIFINFSNAERGITPIWTALPGFEIAGADKVFYPAQAEVDTKTSRLAVWSEKVSEPVAVRYAFKNYLVASIFNVAGIPASSFRTDQW